MKRHKTDWWSFVFGAVFVIIAGGALVAMETGQLIDLRWLVPALAITAGVGIVAAANSRDRQAVTDAPAPAAARAELDEQVPPVE
ncbi:MAG: hypothetical protein AB1Z57_08965 [Acidimicrobiia bacterium]